MYKSLETGDRDLERWVCILGNFWGVGEGAKAGNPKPLSTITQTPKHLKPTPETLKPCGFVQLCIEVCVEVRVKGSR